MNVNLYFKLLLYAGKSAVFLKNVILKKIFVTLILTSVLILVFVLCYYFVLTLNFMLIKREV